MVRRLFDDSELNGVAERKDFEEPALEADFVALVIDFAEIGLERAFVATGATFPISGPVPG